MPDSAPSNIWKSPSWVQIAIALGIAIVSDGFSLIFSALVVAQPLVIGIDLVTGILIWLALGRPILLFAVFIAEAIPGVGVMPLWTAVVVILAVTGRLPKGMGDTAQSPLHSPQRQPSGESLPTSKHPN